MPFANKVGNRAVVYVAHCPEQATTGKQSQQWTMCEMTPFFPSVCFGNISCGDSSLWERKKVFMGKQSMRWMGKGIPNHFSFFFLHESMGRKRGEQCIIYRSRVLAGNDSDSLSRLGCGYPGTGAIYSLSTHTIQQTKTTTIDRIEWTIDEFTQTHLPFFLGEKKREGQKEGRKGQERRLSHPYPPMTMTRKKGE